MAAGDNEYEAYKALSDGWHSYRGESSDVPEVLLRDPIDQPYDEFAFINTPIGGDADLVPLGYTYIPDGAYQNGRVAVAEENILALLVDAPKAYIMETNAGWNKLLTRCGSRTGDILQGNGSVSPMFKLPIPNGFSTDPYIGSVPNMSGCLLYRNPSDPQDILQFETQPLHFCPDGVAVSQFVNDRQVGESIYEGGHGPPIPGGGSQVSTGGSHGGSMMSAFSGILRLGEIVPGGEILHAMKVTMDTGWYCSNVRTGRATEGGAPNTPTTTTGPLANKGGYIWPALQADSGWETSYGNLNPSVPDEAKMGMLMTTLSTFDPEVFNQEPVKIIARAAKNYGIYLVDGDYNASTPSLVQWQVERSNRGRFVTEFKNTWGYEFFHQRSAHGAPSADQLEFRAELGVLMEAMHIVVDNAPDNVGGAGVRRAPLAPPLRILP
jgi:hypothetical protein